MAKYSAFDFAQAPGWLSGDETTIAFDFAQAAGWLSGDETTIAFDFAQAPTDG